MFIWQPRNRGSFNRPKPGTYTWPLIPVSIATRYGAGRVGI
ncbi:MAG: hypothetical protein ACXAAH_01630 [Promethearchaeota archaeon]